MDVIITANISPPHGSVHRGFDASVHTATKAVCTVLIIFVLLLGCLGNALVFLSASELRKLRSNLEVFILNLAMADFLMCSCLSPVFLYVLFAEPPYPRVFCSSFLFLGTACGLLSLLTLVTIALHRQARVVGQSKGSLSSCQAGMALGFIWTISILLALGGTIHVTFGWPDTQTSCQLIVNSQDKLVYNFVLFFVAPVTVLSFILIAMSYSVIAWTVRSQNKACREMSPGPHFHQRQVENTSKRERTKCQRTSPGKLSQTSSVSMYKESKAMTMCLVVTLTIILCWGPLVISQFLELLVGESIILYQVKICGIALVFLNSALNPYIYAQTSSKTKQRYLKWLKKLLTFECKKREGYGTRLQSTVNASLSVNRQRSSNLEQETNTVNLASPKLYGKVFMERNGSVGLTTSYRTVLVTCPPVSTGTFPKPKYRSNPATLNYGPLKFKSQTMTELNRRDLEFRKLPTYCQCQTVIPISYTEKPVHVL